MFFGFTSIKTNQANVFFIFCLHYLMELVWNTNLVDQLSTCAGINIQPINFYYPRRITPLIGSDSSLLQEGCSNQKDPEPAKNKCVYIYLNVAAKEEITNLTNAVPQCPKTGPLPASPVKPAPHFCQRGSIRPKDKCYLVQL